MRDTPTLPRRLPGMAGVRETQEQFSRQTRRLWRLGRLLGQVIVGVVIVHALFHVLRLAPVDRQRRCQHGLVRWWNRGILRILNVHLHVEGRVA